VQQSINKTSGVRNTGIMMNLTEKGDMRAVGKGKVFTYIVTSDTSQRTSGNKRHRQEPAFSVGHCPCPNTPTMDPAAMQPYATPVCPDPNNTCNYMEGWKAE